MSLSLLVFVGVEHTLCASGRFGFYLRDYDLLSPLFTRLAFGQPLHVEHPELALLDLWVSILAGCRSISQVNTSIRPDRLLAQAWGRPCFHEQSVLARVLEGCQAEQVGALRAGTEAFYRWIGQAPGHVRSSSPLTVDIDLTGMLARPHAEGSTKGYFREERGARAPDLPRGSD